MPLLDVSDILITRCVMINSFMFSLLITRTSGIRTSRIGALLPHIPGVPLAFDGRMRIGPPSLPAHVALGGVTSWPAMQSRR